MRIIILKKAVLIRIAIFILLVTGAIVYTRIALSGEEQTFSSGGESTTICSVETDKKQVALTFDTTFGNDQTEALLAVLKEKNVKATFAVMGAWAQENTELVAKIKDAGHEIISHSMSHKRYNEMTTEEVLEDANAAKTLLRLDAVVDTYLIRPPYGACNEETFHALKSQGYIPIRWSIDSMDWKNEGAETVEKNVVSNIKPGAIVVFQNNCKNTTQALPAIIDDLKKLGYSFCGLSDMVLQEKYTVDANGVQRAVPEDEAVASPSPAASKQTKT